MGVLFSVLVLGGLGLAGVAALRRLTDRLDPLERWAYGLPLGVVVGSLVLLGLAIPLGLQTWLVLAVGVASAAGALVAWPWPIARDAIRAAFRAGGATSLGITPIPLAAQTKQSTGAKKSKARQPAPVASRAHEAPQRVPEKRAVQVAPPPDAPLPVLAALARFGWWPVVVIGAFTLRWAVLWASALTVDGQRGLWASQINIWGDWPQHLGDVASFAYGDNFPPQHPRFAGIPYDYHSLPSITAAAMVKLGMSLTSALTFHSFLFSVLTLLGLFAFVRRLTGDRNAAALALALFFLGGTLGWLIIAGNFNQSHNLRDILLHHSWDQGFQAKSNYEWQNVYLSFFEPQRAYLYGLPLALLGFTLLYEGVRDGQVRLFAGAGVVFGLLPLAHLSTLLALALIMPFLGLLFIERLRGWIVCAVCWVALAAPQLYWQQGGGRGATASLRWLPGWVAPPDNWLWFWAKNLGCFWILLALALAAPAILPPLSRRFLWSFMPLFAIANLAVFQPWDWDNHKVLLFWFLAVCIFVAALVAYAWREYRAPLMRTILVGTLATMLASGVLANLYQLAGNDRFPILNAEEVQLATLVREQTPPHALFVTGLGNSHPISTLSGRRVIMSYPGWLWTHGIDTAQRERDVRAIYAFGPEAPDLLRKYGVDYVVVGPSEKQDLKANVAAFNARYKPVITTPNFTVYKVKD